MSWQSHWWLGHNGDTLASSTYDGGDPDEESGGFPREVEVLFLFEPSIQP